MNKQNKIKKTYQIEADVVEMLEELRVYYGTNYNTLINNIIKSSYKQMNNNISFSNTEDLKKVLDYFKDSLDRKDKEISDMKDLLNNINKINSNLSEDIIYLKDRDSKAVNRINQHTTTIDENKKKISLLNKKIDDYISNKNKSFLGFVKKGD